MNSSKLPAAVIIARSKCFPISTRYSSAEARKKNAAEQWSERKTQKMDRGPSESSSFAMNLFHGVVNTSAVCPYPVAMDAERTETLTMFLKPFTKFFEERNDPFENDANEKTDPAVLRQFADLGSLGLVIPPEYGGSGMNNSQMARIVETVGANDLGIGVIMGAHQLPDLGSLGPVIPPEYGGSGMNNSQMARIVETVGANDLGVGVIMGAHQLPDLGSLGPVIPPEYGGSGMNNSQMARIIETVGSNDLGVGVIMGAHQSLGYKGILLHGTEEQKKQYLPDMATGDKLAAFALTEPSAGSDARSIQTQATLTADGQHYVLNGSKIWVSNGGLADVITVFAKTPVTAEDGTTKQRISAFIVERNYDGITSSPNEKKMGIHGSNTTAIHLDDVLVPVHNLLGAEGDGFKIAMTVLNNRRFAVPATMTGVMRHCIEQTVEHITTRVQFGRKLSNYGDVQEKLVNMSIKHYVTETVTYLLSSMMDAGHYDYQMEAAMGKVLGSENAWSVVDDTVQLMGGMGYMKEAGVERVMRDVRVFRIFEGANDILRLFVALTGIQFAGGHLKELQHVIRHPISNFGMLLGEASKRATRTIGLHDHVLSDQAHRSLHDSAKMTTQCVERFGDAVETLLIKHGKHIIDHQFCLTRLANASIDIYSMAAVISRCSKSLKANTPSSDYEKIMVNLFCQQAADRVLHQLAVLTSRQHAGDADKIQHLSDAICQNRTPLQARPLGV